MNTKALKDRISKLPGGGIKAIKIKNKDTETFYEYHAYKWRNNGK